MTVRKDMSKNNANQQEARNGPIVDSNGKIMYGNNMRTNRNELMRRLLSGITTSELQNLVRMREEARRPIPAPRTKKPQPVPAPRTIISEKRGALNCYTKS